MLFAHLSSFPKMKPTSGPSRGTLQFEYDDIPITGNSVQHTPATESAAGSFSQMFAHASQFEISNSIFQVAHNIINNKTVNNVWKKEVAPSGYQEKMSNINSQPHPPDFIGRKDNISLLENHFIKGESSTAQHKQKIYLLWGLGGSGKTQTALEFAFQFEDQFTKIWIIHAASESLIQASFYDIAQQINWLWPTWLAGKRWLEANKEEWLVIYDNADDPDLNLGKFLPACRHGNVIITSRNAALIQLTMGPSGYHKEVRDMGHTDAVQLLLSCAGMSHNANLEEQEMAGKIAQTLHCFPLTLVQAGAYIKQQQCLMEYLESQRAEIMAINMSHNFDDYTLSMYSTWNLSWKKLSNPAQEFLRICSHMHFENIPREVFQKAVQNINKVSLEHPGPLIDQVIVILERLFTSPSHWNDTEMDGIISELERFSLINVLKHGKLYNIHPLVHHWVFDEMKNQADLITGFLAVSMQTISKDEMPFVLQVQEHCKFVKPLDFHEVFILEAFRKLWSLSGHHVRELELAQALVKISEANLGKNHPETLNYTEKLGVVYRLLGRYNDALVLETPLLKLSEEVLGKEHPDTLTRIQNLAMIYINLGRYNDALELEEPLLKLSEMVLGKEHPNTLTGIQNLAMTYINLGRYNDALELEEPLLKLSEQVLGKEHPDTLTQIQNLAITYTDLGRYNDALELEEPLLKLSEQVLGKEHPDTLTRIQNLAITYTDLGRYNDALELEEPLLKLSEQVLGKEHPDTLTRIQNLAMIYINLGRYNDALELEEPLLKLTEMVLGKEHPNTLTGIQNLAMTYIYLGRYNDALDLEEPLLKLSEMVLGKEHPHTLTRIQNLAMVYTDLGRYNDALDLEEHLLKLSEQVLGKEHPSTLGRIQNLAVTYKNLGQYNDALELEEHLLKLSEQVLGKEHPNTLSRILNLAITYTDLGRYNDALDLEEPLLKLSEQVLGKEHPNTLAQIQNLAMTYKNLGKYNNALDLEEPLLKISEQVLGKEHPNTLTRIQNLAITYKNLRQYNNALEMEEPLLKLSEKVLGNEHPDTLTRIQNLVITYKNLGQYNNALELHKTLLKLSKKVLGNEHPDTLTRIQNLAITYKDLGQYNDALELHKTLLKLSKKVLGEDHPDTLTQIQHLAATYAELGQYNNILELEELLLKLSGQVLGKEHPDTLTQIHNLKLQAAAMKGLDAVVQLLMDNHVHSVEGHEKALETAAFHGHASIVMLLLEKGTAPNAKRVRYANALQMASSNGHAAIVKALLEYGADPALESAEHKTTKTSLQKEGDWTPTIPSIMKNLIDRKAEGISPIISSASSYTSLNHDRPMSDFQCALVEYELIREQRAAHLDVKEKTQKDSQWFSHITNVDQMLDQVQSELDLYADALDLCGQEYHKKCLRFLHHLSKKVQAIPSSLLVQNIKPESQWPVAGGGFADVYLGLTADGKVVCLKVLRLIISQDDGYRARIRKKFYQEALVWRQLKHPNILPLLGVSTELFTPSFCLVSPWMMNKDIITYIKNNSDQDIFQFLSDIAAGISYLHSRDPPIVHGDI
ncbi:TPR-like protein [Gymnopus androsaceus JB14]|uniref:TPR-like protein n=1 Tax=Gymnopus androsaceus JB14 TaxID=1447944 RepID=A0A6A4H977_9AGAR|nr:TPR-like protein [Gymnopus androsaceus JB14]